MLKLIKENGIVTAIIAIGMAMSMMFGYSYGLEVGRYNPVTHICTCACQEQIEVEEPDEPIVIAEPIVEKPVEPAEPEYPISQEEIELIALVTMAEAEGEPEEGKRLVIDTILNRVDGVYWPDTVHEVIYQPSQFTSMWNGRVNRCYVREDICELVKEELLSRTNDEVVFFTAGKYGKYGEPMFKLGNHYFAKYA